MAAAQLDEVVRAVLAECATDEAPGARLKSSAVPEEVRRRAAAASAAAAAALSPHLDAAWERACATVLDSSAVLRVDLEEAWARAMQLCDGATLAEQRFAIVGKLGAGMFATVHLAFDRELRKNVALKIYEGKHVPKATQELAIWRACTHPNVVRLYDSIVAPDRVYAVIELAPGGELLAKLSEVDRFDERAARQIFRQCAEALAYLHDEAGVAHRDIKPENLLCTSPEPGEIGALKLGDFGFAARISAPELLAGFGGGGGGAAPRPAAAAGSAQGGPPPPSQPESPMLSPTAPTTPPTPAPGWTSRRNSRSNARLTRLVGTPDYMAPEQILIWRRRERERRRRAAAQRQGGADGGAALGGGARPPPISTAAEQSGPDADGPDFYDESVDCWALGCIAYELLSGSPPFVDEDDERLHTLICCAPVSFDDEAVWGGVSEHAKDLIVRLLERDPSKRLRAAEALNHPWLAAASPHASARAPARVSPDAAEAARLSSVQRNREHVREVRRNRRFRVGGIAVGSIVRMEMLAHATMARALPRTPSPPPRGLRAVSEQAAGAGAAPHAPAAAASAELAGPSASAPMGAATAEPPLESHAQTGQDSPADEARTDGAGPGAGSGGGLLALRALTCTGVVLAASVLGEGYRSSRASGGP